MKVRQTMGMTIDDSERYLRLMLGGMKNAVEYWKDKDKEEFDIEQTNVEAVKAALDTMRKYQKIQEIVKSWEGDTWTDGISEDCMEKISEVMKDGNNN